jgi:phospholipid/cholesterol/gamma-HCH transport system substrate-binding protein
MRRIALTAIGLFAVALLVALPAIGADDGPYKVRAVFDNGGFIVDGEEVRVAGARVGQVESVDISRDDEIVSLEDGPKAIPGKAVVVLAIDDDGFKDFREDASCIIRPQSLIGEKYVDCTVTQPRAPGSEPPPELEEIPDGEPGEGQRLLPLENNGKAVDLDLIQNINRAPYRDRFRIILNDLGAGLAARGDDLGEVIDRANPALRQTNRVLAILAQQSDQLASLASNGDAVLEPLARNRTSITGFFRNAAVAGQATAERGDELEAGLERFPETLREVRLTMAKLKEFGDQGTALFGDLKLEAKDLSRTTQKLAPFARAGIPAFDTLGDAAQAAGPKLVAANPVLVQLKDLGAQTGPSSQSLSEVLDTFARTKGIQYLMDFIYGTVGSLNGFDAFGHFQRANILVTACTTLQAEVFPGCEATFPPAVDEPKKKKKKKKKKRSRKSSGGFSAPQGSSSPQPSIPPPTIDQLIPELQPPADEPDGAPPPAPEDGGAEPGGAAPATDAAQASAARGALGSELAPLTVDDASLLLQFLLGSPS